MLKINSLLPNKKILALDMGSYKIKALVGREKNNRIIIDDYFTIPTPKGAYIDGRIMDKVLLHYAIDEALKKNGIKVKDVYLTINSSEIIVREVIIPKVEAEEVEKLLSFQIEDYIPVDPENFVVQFKLIDTTYEDNIEKLSLLLIGIPKEIVENHFELLKDLALNPLVLDYQPNSMAKLLGLSNFINKDYPTKDFTFAVIDIGYENTKVSIVKNGIIYLSRVVEIGGKYIDQSIVNNYGYDDYELMQIKEGLDDLNKFYGENSEHTAIYSLIKGIFVTLNERIEMIFRYYLSRSSNNQISMILLYGGNANYAGLDNFFSNYFNIPTIIVESFDKVNFNGKIFEYINSIGALVRR